MKKGYLVGGLAIVGAVALFMYLKPKPRRNSDGFFNASGRTMRYDIPVCTKVNPDGTRSTVSSLDGQNCPKGYFLKKPSLSMM
jgi:hypothetical protein